ncbi:MAG: VOC family protein [Flavobacteriaceae bacterium]|nr:VOC family protein [Flavobacteriaceae bacterium]
MKNNLFGWIEIPVNDMDRAIAFYEEVFQLKIDKVDFGGMLMGWFPSADQNVYGATGTLIQQESYIPSHEGTMVYFNCDDVQNELDRVEKAGGKIIQGKSQISEEHGYMGTFQDSEGNRLALHSQA